MVESITSKISMLPDPYGDRSAKSIDPPPNKPLENSFLYPYSGTLSLLITAHYLNIVVN
jgi:hypothetical protein